ncbi:MAG: hypothetical protein KGH66_03555 [Candidatus Micrarchaeota archaeon]|nr:hypothetical protein [Candidatus Micrarchaeota archaeon]
MVNVTLAAELYIRTVLRKEFKPALETAINKVDAAIEAVGARKKTAALVLLGADIIPAALAVQGMHHDTAVTAVTMGMIAPPAYVMEYYCVKAAMVVYHRLKAHLRKEKAQSNDAVGSFYFRA